MTDFKIGDKVQIDPALVNSGARVAPLGVVGTVFELTSGGMFISIEWATVQSINPSWELVRVVEPPKKLEARREDH